jgi:hypothetical protein
MLVHHKVNNIPKVFRDPFTSINKVLLDLISSIHRANLNYTDKSHHNRKLILLLLLRILPKQAKQLW